MQQTRWSRTKVGWVFFTRLALVFILAACNLPRPGTQTPSFEDAVIETTGEAAQEETAAAETAESQQFAPLVSGGNETPPAAETTPEPSPQATPSNLLYAPLIYQQATQPAGPVVEPETTQAVDPHVEVEASPVILQIGDPLTVMARPVDIGVPYYQLLIQDGEAGNPTPIVQVTYENNITRLEGTSQILELVSAEGEMDQAVFTLQARRAGTAVILVLASGEIHYGYPGPAGWGGGRSEAVMVTVNSP